MLVTEVLSVCLDACSDVDVMMVGGMKGNKVQEGLDAKKNRAVIGGYVLLMLRLRCCHCNVMRLY